MRLSHHAAFLSLLYTDETIFSPMMIEYLIILYLTKVNKFIIKCMIEILITSVQLIILQTYEIDSLPIWDQKVLVPTLG